MKNEHVIFDTHAHYDDKAFDPDRDEVLSRLPEEGIGRIVNVSADEESLERVRAIAKMRPWIYAAYGIHPSECAQMDEVLLERVRSLLHTERAVAVGEIGLDYHWEEPARDVQKRWFREQLLLARQEHLPVIIHSRDAAQDTLQILKEMNAQEIGGVIHCYSYSVEMAREFVKMGFYIGIGGALTFKNARKVKEVAAQIPIDRIVLETDCPYMAPVPHRGERNWSPNLVYVAQALAQIRGTTAEEIADLTYTNALRLYRLSE
ncbi:MAG: TatD family hydrolase [Lachnospiraceae bacterium]|nr:TatD family hydrolase [Lachnospiraceae bacterium]